MRTAVLNLAEMGEIPDERIGDEEFWKPWDAAVRAITKPATDEEAACILDLFPDERAILVRTCVAPPALRRIGTRLAAMGFAR